MKGTIYRIYKQALITAKKRDRDRERARARRGKRGALAVYKAKKPARARGRCIGRYRTTLQLSPDDEWNKMLPL